MARSARRRVTKAPREREKCDESDRSIALKGVGEGQNGSPSLLVGAQSDDSLVQLRECCLGRPGTRLIVALRLCRSGASSFRRVPSSPVPRSYLPTCRNDPHCIIIDYSAADKLP